MMANMTMIKFKWIIYTHRHRVHHLEDWIEVDVFEHLKPHICENAEGPREGKEEHDKRRPSTERAVVLDQVFLPASQLIE